VGQVRYARVVNADEALARERWSKEGDDDALVRLVNMLLITMARADTTCFRVRSDAEPAIETYGPSGWAPFVDLVPPKKVREPIIWRLKLMAEIAVDAAVMFAAKFKLMLGGGSSGLRDYDVCFSRTASGSRIVVTRVPTVYGWRSNAELVGRATILLAQADEATSRDEVRARAREAVALVPEGGGARVSISQTAAATCGRAGLVDEALSLSSLALPLADDPRERAHVEETIALVHEDTRKLDEAADGYARALATAETSRRTAETSLDAALVRVTPRCSTIWSDVLFSFGEYETIDDAANALAALKRDLVEQTSPRRTVRLGPVLFERNARWKSFNEVSFDDPLRVPTEDEWEWAASGGSDAFFRWGDFFPLRFAPPGPEENRLGDTTPDFDAVVQPNAFGLTIARDPYDYEWCATRGIFKGGDGGVSWHGGAGTLAIWASIATSFRYRSSYEERQAGARRVFVLEG
jgi:hypothetical protein